MSTAPRTPADTRKSWASVLTSLDWYDEYRIARFCDPKWRSGELARLRRNRKIMRVSEAALLIGIAVLFVVDRIVRLFGQASLLSAGSIAQALILAVVILFFLGWLESSSWNRRIVWLNCLGELDARLKALENPSHD
jgi:hypothetical protein